MAWKRIDQSKYEYDALIGAVRKWKKKNGYTDYQIGAIVGLCHATVSHFFHGDTVSDQTVYAIARAAKVDIKKYEKGSVEEYRAEDSVFDFESLREDVRSFLEKKGMSQAKFAKTYGIPNETVNNFLTAFHTGLREQTVRLFCGAIGKPYDSYIKGTSPDGTTGYSWVARRNRWQYSFMLNGIRRSVYGKTKEECEAKAQKMKEKILTKESEKPVEDVHVDKCPDGKCRIDITVYYEIIEKVMKDCLAKTFEEFLEKHTGEYKRRRRWN